MHVKNVHSKLIIAMTLKDSINPNVIGFSEINTILPVFWF